jgi:hypothetical protein
MTITLTREEAQQVLDVIERNIVGVPRYRATELLRTRLSAPEPEYRNVVIKGDLWRIEFLPDHAASVVLVRANYEAQPEPEPVADKYLMEVECTKCGAKQDGILTVNTPPQRNWQGLTDEEMFDCLAQTDGEAKRLPLGFKWFAEAIEAKLKEKNA